MKLRGKRRFVVIGHSTGGVVALRAAQSTRDVIACVGIASVGETHKLGERFQITALERDQSIFVAKIWGDTYSLDKSFFQDLSRTNVASMLATLTIPILSIHGDRDKVIPLLEIQSLITAVPGHVQLAVIRGANHQFSLLRMRHKLSESILGWLENHFA